MTQKLWHNEVTWLRQKLVGDFYSSFSSSDVWQFQFSGLRLLANEFASPGERDVESLLSSFLAGAAPVDADDVPKAVIASSLKRKVITGVEIDADCVLKLRFDSGGEITVPVCTDIVDWHWCFNETGRWPHEDCIVGCFTPGVLDTRIEG